MEINCVIGIYYLQKAMWLSWIGLARLYLVKVRLALSMPYLICR
jgi:hypothetical protein